MSDRSVGSRRIALYFAAAVLLLAAPFLIDATLGRTWVRIVDVALLFIMLALGLNIVVGYAGLLDLGYIAFFAVGAYGYALLASPQFDIHWSFLALLPLGALVAAFFGVLLGAPTLRLRGDYLAIVTLGFGEIIRIFLNNLNRPVQHHQRPAGHHAHRPAADRRREPRQDAHDRRPHDRVRCTATTSCSSRVRSPRSSSRGGSRIRASAARGSRSAKTSSPPRRWASTRAT